MFPFLLQPHFYSEPQPSSLASFPWVSPSKLWKDPYFALQMNIDMTSLGLSYFGSECSQMLTLGK